MWFHASRYYFDSYDYAGSPLAIVPMQSTFVPNRFASLTELLAFEVNGYRKLLTSKSIQIQNHAQYFSAGGQNFNSIEGDRIAGLLIADLNRSIPLWFIPSNTLLPAGTDVELIWDDLASQTILYTRSGWIYQNFIMESTGDGATIPSLLEVENGINNIDDFDGTSLFVPMVVTNEDAGYATTCNAQFYITPWVYLLGVQQQSISDDGGELIGQLDQFLLDRPDLYLDSELLFPMIGSTTNHGYGFRPRSQFYDFLIDEINLDGGWCLGSTVLDMALNNHEPDSLLIPMTCGNNDHGYGSLFPIKDQFTYPATLTYKSNFTPPVLQLLRSGDTFTLTILNPNENFKVRLFIGESVSGATVNFTLLEDGLTMSDFPYSVTEMSPRINYAFKAQYYFVGELDEIAIEVNGAKGNPRWDIVKLL